MISTEGKNKINSQITISFEFKALKKMIKISLNPRSTLKSLRPLLSARFGADFAHIPLKFKTKSKKS